MYSYRFQILCSFHNTLEGGAVERALIEETLRPTHGNVSRAADLLGLSRGALRNKITRHRIDSHDFARPLPTPV